MLKKPYRIGALLATLAAVGTMAVAAAPAGATFTPCTPAEKEAEICIQLTAPFIGYHVSGTLVAGGQTIHLPVTGGPLVGPKGEFLLQNHPGYTGYALIALRSPFLASDFQSGSINNVCPAPPLFGPPFENPTIQFLLHPCGATTPPFTQNLEFPKNSAEKQDIGLTTEETPAEIGCAPADPFTCQTPAGELHSTAASNCPSPVIGEPFSCVHEAVNTALRLGYSVHGPGNGAASKTQSQCETVEPTKLALVDNLTFREFAFLGSRFVGSTTIPTITCTGKYANGRGNQMTEDFSGPATFDICVQPVAPPPPGAKLAGCPEF
jgi:hypothetical protein